jgi:hypothetical protein
MHWWQNLTRYTRHLSGPTTTLLWHRFRSIATKRGR